MKTLIKKADGTPTKSKVHALQFLAKNGIEKDCLIEKNGQFSKVCPFATNYYVNKWLHFITGAGGSVQGKSAIPVSYGS